MGLGWIAFHWKHTDKILENVNLHTPMTAMKGGGIHKWNQGHFGTS